MTRYDEREVRDTVETLRDMYSSIDSEGLAVELRESQNTYTAPDHPYPSIMENSIFRDERHKDADVFAYLEDGD